MVTKKKQDEPAPSLVGRRVQKLFKGFGKFSGTVTAYNTSRRFYKVVYDDGDREELEAHEIQKLLVDSAEDVTTTNRKRPRDANKGKPSRARKEDATKRQRRESASRLEDGNRSSDLESSEELDRRNRGRQSAQKAKCDGGEEDSPSPEGEEEEERQKDGDVQQSTRGSSKRKRRDETEDVEESCPPTKSNCSNGYRFSRNRVRRGQKFQQSSDDDEADVDDEESSDFEVGSSEDGLISSESSDEESSVVVHAKDFEELDLPALQPLPSSSGDFVLSEELMAEVFAVYSFLRSFSRALFLSPFCLDEFVRALTTDTPNNLIDSVHLSLLQALRRHLQRLSKESSQEAKNCLRQPDWNLLDNITWPSFLMVFLVTYGFSKLYGERITALGLLECEYYNVPVKTKLAVLGFLCDQVMETEEIRAEIDTREVEYTSQSRPKEKRRSIVKATDTSVEGQELLKGDALPRKTRRSAPRSSAEAVSEKKLPDTQDWNSDECVLCGMDGNLICCDGCPAAYHSRCVGISRASLPPGDWFCPECIVEKVGGKQSRRMEGLRGAQLLGIDPYNRTFMSTCGYLLVIELLDNSKSGYKYYNTGAIEEVLETLETLKPFCNKVAKAIRQHWNVPDRSGSNLQEENREDLGGIPGLVSGSDNPGDRLKSALDIKDSTLNNESGLKDVAPPATSESVGSPKTTDNHTSDSTPHAVTVSESDRKSVEGMPVVTLNDSLNKQSSGQPIDQDPYLAQKVTDRDTKGRFLTGGSREYSQPDQFHKSGIYINHYLLGDTSATAAANLALITAEETLPSESKGLKKKTRATTTAEQLKAFYQAPLRFCWPSLKKKLMEIPKERCGWCFCCSNSNLKRGCLINQVATHLAAGAARVAGGIRPTKSGPGHLPAVAGYLLHIEDSLRSLLSGPWENAYFRKLWRKKLEQAVSVCEVRTALLELEANVRSIVFSEDWSKCVEDTPSMSLGGSAALAANDAPIRKGSSRKSSRRSGTSRRRLSTSSGTSLGTIQWWRRGKVAYRVSGWALLPQKVARKVGREGGLKRIVGLTYTDGGEIPKRSKLYAWRARTQSACTIAELAVQVRFLDARLRWDDLASTVQLLPVGSKCESDDMVEEKKPAIHSKSFKEGVPLYLVDSALSLNQGGQQNFVQIQQVPKGSVQSSGEKQVWVDERQVPLSLLREFEESDRLLRQNKLPKLALLQKQYISTTKVHKKDVFNFLRERAGLLTPAKLSISLTCKFCSAKVPVSMAVQCHVCQGPFHKDCTVAANLPEGHEPKHVCRGCLKVAADTKSRQLSQSSGSCQLPKSGQSQTTSETGAVFSVKQQLSSSCKLPKNGQLTVTSDTVALNQRSASVRVPKSELRSYGTSHTTSDAVRCSYEEPRLIFRWKPPKKEGQSQVVSSMAGSNLNINTGASFERKAGVPDNQSQLSQLQDSSGTPNMLHRRSEKSLQSEGVFWRRNGMEPRELGQDKLVLPAGQNCVRPKCFLCRQQYRPDLLYIRCEYCPLWFHGDAIGVTEENLNEFFGYKCHKCRKKSGPCCPYGTKHKSKKRSIQQLVHQDDGKVTDTEAKKVKYEGSSERNEALDPHLDQVQQQPLHVISPDTCIPTMQLVAQESHVEYQPGYENCNLTTCSSTPASPSFEEAASTLGFQTGVPLSEDGMETGFGSPLINFGQLLTRTEDSGLLQEGYEQIEEETFGGSDIATVNNISSADHSSYACNASNFPRTTLSFTELLSSEDDHVEELAKFAMDFGHAWFETSDPNAVIGGLEPIDTFGIQNTNDSLTGSAVEESGRITCTICFKGLVGLDLQCIGCGIAVHQQCLDWSPVGSWTADGWACNACKSRFFQRQENLADCMQLVDSRILLQS